MHSTDRKSRTGGCERGIVLNTSRPAHAGGARKAQRAFTVLEILTAVAVGGLILAIAVPSYTGYIQRARVASATTDIFRISSAINHYQLTHDALPSDLAAIGFDTLLDPWGRPYAYLSFAGLKGKGKMRKDKNLVPINTQYDLYSVGADGKSQAPLTAAASRDDVIMANDGAYVGLASNY